MGEHGHDPLDHPTWLRFLYAKHILPSWLPEMAPVTWLVVLILCITVILASRKLVKRNPGRFQAFLEFCVSSLDSFVRGIVGDQARMVTPVIGTFFIYILTLNLFGLIPGFMSPTSDINTTVSLALFAIIYVQYVGIRKQGVVNYVKHFLGEPLWLAPLMLPIHIIGELARPLSLSVRLFGNIFGEEMIVIIIVTIIVSVLWPFAAPLQFPMMLFAIFGSLVQALVFSMLVSIYIAVAIAGHEEH